MFVFFAEISFDGYNMETRDSVTSGLTLKVNVKDQGHTSDSRANQQQLSLVGAAETSPRLHASVLWRRLTLYIF